MMKDVRKMKQENERLTARVALLESDLGIMIGACERLSSKAVTTHSIEKPDRELMLESEVAALRAACQRLHKKVQEQDALLAKALKVTEEFLYDEEKN